MGLRGPLPRHSPKVAAPTSTLLPPPAWLPPPAVEVWQEIEPCLRAAGRLRHEHGDMLAAWACTAAELRVLSVVIARDGSTATGPHGTHPSAAHSAAVRLRTTLLTLGKALGLDPASWPAWRLWEALPTMRSMLSANMRHREISRAMSMMPSRSAARGSRCSITCGGTAARPERTSRTIPTPWRHS